MTSAQSLPPPVGLSAQIMSHSLGANQEEVLTSFHHHQSLAPTSGYHLQNHQPNPFALVIENFKSGNLNQSDDQSHPNETMRFNEEISRPQAQIVHQTASNYATNRINKYNNNSIDSSENNHIFSHENYKLNENETSSLMLAVGGSARNSKMANVSSSNNNNTSNNSGNSNSSDHCHERMNKLRERLFRILSKVPIQVAPIQQIQPDGSKKIVSIDKEPLVIKYYSERHMRDILDLHFESSLIKHNHERGLKHITTTTTSVPLPHLPSSGPLPPPVNQQTNDRLTCWSAVIEQQQQGNHLKFDADFETKQSPATSQQWRSSKRQQIISYSKHHQRSSSSTITKDNSKLNGHNQSTVTGPLSTATTTMAASKRANVRANHGSLSHCRRGQHDRQTGNGVIVHGNGIGSTNLKQRISGLPNSTSTSQQILQQQQQQPTHHQQEDTYASNPANAYAYQVAPVDGVYNEQFEMQSHHQHPQLLNHHEQAHNYLYDQTGQLYVQQQQHPVNFNHSGQQIDNNHQLAYGTSVNQSSASVHYYHQHQHHHNHPPPAATALIAPSNCDQVVNNYYQTDGMNSFDPMGLVSYATQLHLNGSNASVISGAGDSNPIDCISSESNGTSWQHQQSQSNCVTNPIETLIVSHHQLHHHHHHHQHNNNNNNHHHPHLNPNHNLNQPPHLQMIEVLVANNATNNNSNNNSSNSDNEDQHHQHHHHHLTTPTPLQNSDRLYLSETGSGAPTTSYSVSYSGSNSSSTSSSSSSSSTTTTATPTSGQTSESQQTGCELHLIRQANTNSFPSDDQLSFSEPAPHQLELHQNQSQHHHSLASVNQRAT